MWERRQRGELFEAIERDLQQSPVEEGQHGKAGKHTKTTRKQAKSTPVHDNGAVGSKDHASEKRSNRQSSKEKKLMDELEKVKAELAKVQLEKEALLTASNSTASNSTEQTPTRNEHGGCTESTSHTLLASVNNMSLSTMSIPECKPSEGEVDIDKKGYEYWKSILVASLNLIQATDEKTKFDVFKIKAGPHLLELLQGTNSTAEMPDENTYPFTNALARLDCYFGSRAYMLSQRSKLMNTVQRPGETSIQFVRRVGASAKLCGYDKKDDEMEAIARTVMKSSTEKRVRTLAHRNWIKQGSLNDLIDLVRDHETELANEAEFLKTHKPQTSASVAAITGKPEQVQFYRNSRGRTNPGNPGRGMYHRVGSRNQGPQTSACWRCASTYHNPAQCPDIGKMCYNCNRQGHLSRCCNRRPVQAATKRPAQPDNEAPPRKIAAIKNEEEKKDDEPAEVSELD